MYYDGIGLKQFLEESEAKLQKVFDSACKFSNIHGFLMEQSENRLTKDIASMKVMAGKLLDTNNDMSEAGKCTTIHML